LLDQGITGDIPEIIANRARLYEGDLIAYFRAIFFNAANLENPYHNLRHSLHVMWLCHDACRYYRGDLAPRQMRHLLLAALFHDFNHPGHPHPRRRDPDGVNINHAIEGLRQCITPGDEPFLPGIEGLILSTHFPYTVPGIELSLSGQIIRDADLSQALSPAWLQQIVIGLARELGLKPIDMLKAQPSFLAGLRFNTQWARELFPAELVASKIAEAEALLRLLHD
jgi:HD domain